MSAGVMALVLFSAFLHASWNAVVKSSPDKLLDVVLVTGGGTIISVFLLAFLPLPAVTSWPYLGISTAVHVLYFVLVGAAYRAGDLSYVYPLMRGTPPLLVALASGTLIGEHLSPAGWGGILLICGGIFSFMLAQPGAQRVVGRTTAIALGNAVAIAAYTFIDGVGVRASSNAISYSMWLFFLSGIPFVAWALLSRRNDLMRHVERRWYVAIIGGLCTIGAYTLVLWAMTHLPIALVAALRETAILFGMLMSALILKERFGWRRYVGAASMMLGAIVLRFG